MPNIQPRPAPYYDTRVMLEEAAEEDRVKKEGLPTFLIKKYFGWALVFCFALFFLAFVLKDERGQPILPQNYFIAGVILVILIFVLPSIISLVAKRPTEKYVPFNPEKEKPELEEKLSKIYGGTHKIYMHAGDEKYTSKAGEPNVMFIRFKRIDGVVVRIGTAKIGLIGRPIIDYEPGHTHIENMIYDWTGAPKYPPKPTKYSYTTPRYIYRFNPTSVEPTTKVVGREETEEEIKEDKQED
jgi:hypothetical protein